MPPKKQPAKISAKEKQKIVEDKTFGMKNKNKSAKVQKYISAVEKQVENQGQPKKVKPEPPKKSKAELEAEKKNELNQLFRITQAKVPVGVDPKSIVCEFFKQNQCVKGAKCKFSHDLATARKAEKIDLYTDRRDKEEDTMETWSQDKLEEVVNSKQDSHNKNLPTEIICKYFLEALENKKYGWFWECPNGVDKCQYRHALPPGFVLNKKKKAEEEDEAEKPTIEEEIEEARQQLMTHTPVTYEKFIEWKKKKEIEKEEKKKKEMEERQREIKAGRKEMSGREMFSYNPELFVDDEEAFGEEAYEEQEEELVTVLTATGTSITSTTFHNPTHEEDEEEAQGETTVEETPEKTDKAAILSNVDQSLFDAAAEDFGDEDDEE